MTNPQASVNSTAGHSAQAAKDLPPESPTQAELHKSFPTGHPRVMRWARIAGRVLPPSHRAVLTELSCYVDYDKNDGLAWPSQTTLAANTGLDRTTVCRNLSKVEARGGLLTSDGRFYQDEGKSHKVYRLAGVDTDWYTDFPDEADIS